ncbi:MAG TPA: hypothetical protein VFM46_00825, partial [Pseudomonadales bacterium]|nr:hypothetical protein [Pseudomonadales bacterium]
MTPSRYTVLAAALASSATGWAAIPGKFPDQETACAFDASREAARQASAASHPVPHISAVLVNGAQVWSEAAPFGAISLAPGDQVTLQGSGFGAGPDIDFSKIMIGNSRVLETDLSMYVQKLDIFTQVNYELNQTKTTWDKNILDWNDTQLSFTVPVHVSKGPLWIQTQKRTG